MLNLKKLDKKLAAALAKETPESLTAWLLSKRTNLIEELKELNPYPEEVFTPATDEEMNKAIDAIEAAGLVPERIFSNWARTVWGNCVKKVEEIVSE